MSNVIIEGEKVWSCSVYGSVIVRSYVIPEAVSMETFMVEPGLKLLVVKPLI